MDQISLYLTRKSALYSSVVVRRIFCFSLVLAIEAITGFSVCSLDANNWLILFRVEKMSKGWSFWSVTRTSLLSCSCFFFPLVDVGPVELVVLLATLLVVGAEEEGGTGGEEGGAKVEAERPFFSFSA